MGSFIIKVAPDEDLYLEWSTIVEAPTAVADRAEMLKHLTTGGWRGPTEPSAAEERLARADRTGTSMLDCDFGGWDCAGEIYMQQGFLPRARMGEFARRLLADENAEPTDLLEPFEGDV